MEGKSPKELATKAWNSQWDALLLGALFNCEIGFNFQADVAPEFFSSAKEFHIMNYAFKGLIRQKLKVIRDSEHKWLSAHYVSARKLLDNDQYSNAIHSLSSYRWHSMPRVQLAILWSGIEGLFGVDYELSFRLSLYIARYLSPRNNARQKAIFDKIKKLYATRSQAVHGGKIKNLQDSVCSSGEILRKLVEKCAERSELPNTNTLAP